MILTGWKVKPCHSNSRQLRQNENSFTDLVDLIWECKCSYLSRSTNIEVHPADSVTVSLFVHVKKYLMKKQTNTAHIWQSDTKHNKKSDYESSWLVQGQLLMILTWLERKAASLRFSTVAYTLEMQTHLAFKFGAAHFRNQKIVLTVVLDLIK